MIRKIHDRLQSFIDSIVDSDYEIHKKINMLKEHLLEYEEDYQTMLFSFFDPESLEKDQYSYITYTYHDLPINMNHDNEIVASLLFDKENQFYFEITVFNFNHSSDEKTIRFNKQSELLN